MFKMVPVVDLKKHPKNVAYFGEIKDTSESFWDEFKKNIEMFGVLEPLVVNSVTMEVISGNQRLRASKELKLDKVPCVLIEPEDRDTEIEQMLSANIYRRPTDALQLFELVKILRARIEGHQGKATSGPAGQKPPSEEISDKLGKRHEFTNAADLYHSLPREAQKELKDWFYAQEDRPTDKKLIEKVKLLERDVVLKDKNLDRLSEAIAEKEETLKELKKGGKDTLDQLKAMQKEIKVLRDVDKQRKDEYDLQRMADLMRERLDAMSGQAATLSTSIVRFMESIEKNGTDVSGIGPAIIKSKLNILRGQLNQMFARFDSQKLIAKGETND